MKKIISFSGVDGAGKTTLANEVAKNVKSKGYAVNIVHTGDFKKIRSAYLIKSNFSYYLVLLKDLYQIYRAIILNKSDFLIFDRYIYDSLAKVHFRFKTKRIFFDKLIRLITPESFPVYIDSDIKTLISRDNDFKKEYYQFKLEDYRKEFSKLKEKVKINSKEKVNHNSKLISNKVIKKDALFLNIFFPPKGGGGGKVSAEIVTRLSNKYNFTVICSGDYNEIKNVFFLRLFYSGANPILFSMFAYLKFLFWKNRKNIDLIVGTSLQNIFFLLFKTSRIKNITIIHNTYWQRFGSKSSFFYKAIYPPLILLENIGFFLSDKIISVAKTTYNYIPDIFKNKTVIIENGVDLKKFCANKNKGGKIGFLFVGRVEKTKRVLETVKIFKKYLKNESGAKLTIVGDGNELLKVKKYIANSHLSKNIATTGWVKDTTLFYKEKNVLLLFSKAEGLPLVLIEAAASGLPIICTTNASGKSKIIQNGVNGYIVSDKLNEKIIIAKMRKVAESYDKFSINSLKIVKNYDWETIADSYSKIFAKLLNEKTI